ncbi:hypothetical protein IJZ97_03615, partial [bacterium]|nr:hypothetical protein [bacterium]
SVELSRKFADKYLVPYLSGIYECSSGSNDENEKFCGGTVSTHGVNYVLNNGATMSVIANYAETRKPVSIMLTVNFQKDYLMGRDNFYFEIVNGKVQPAFFSNDLTREDILNGKRITLDYSQGSTTYTLSCKKTQPAPSDDGVTELHRHGCTALLYLDGFEFKEDYPW